MTKASVAGDALEDTPHLRHVVWVGDGAAMTPTPGKDAWEWSRLIQCATIESDIVPASGTIDVDLATLIYTSGSTGEPKGVMSSHRNMMSAAKSIIQYIGNAHDDIIIDVLPLSFDYGLYQVIMAFMLGGTVVREKSFAFPVKVIETSCLSCMSSGTARTTGRNIIQAERERLPCGRRQQGTGP